MVIDGLHNEKDGGNGKSSCGQVVGSTVEGMLRVRVNVVASEFPRMVRKARIENVSRDRLFLHLANSRSSSIAYTTWRKSDEELTKDEKSKIERFERIHQYRKIEDYYVRNVMSEELKALSEKDSYKYIRILKEKVYLWWKLRNDHKSNPVRLYEPAEESESNRKSLAKCKIQGKLGHGGYSQVFWGHFEDTPMAFKIYRRIAMRTYRQKHFSIPQRETQTHTHIENWFEPQVRSRTNSQFSKGCVSLTYLTLCES